MRGMRITREVRRQELDRHTPAKPAVFGFVHDSHAAFAERPQDVVVGKALTEHAA